MEILRFKIKTKIDFDDKFVLIILKFICNKQTLQ